MSASATIARAESLNDASLDIDAVVAALRELRAAAAPSCLPVPRRKLPSPQALSRVVDELVAALYPNRLRLPELFKRVGNLLSIKQHDADA